MAADVSVVPGAVSSVVQVDIDRAKQTSVDPKSRVKSPRAQARSWEQYAVTKAVHPSPASPVGGAAPPSPELLPDPLPPELLPLELLLPEPELAELPAPPSVGPPLDDPPSELPPSVEGPELLEPHPVQSPNANTNAAEARTRIMRSLPLRPSSLQ
jgi:hypothetical protein